MSAITIEQLPIKNILLTRLERMSALIIVEWQIYTKRI